MFNESTSLNEIEELHTYLVERRMVGVESSGSCRALSEHIK